MRAFALISLPVAALALTACDAATEMAGDAIKDQIRTEVVSQCEQIAQDNGITSENVTPACECAADRLAEDASDASLDINRETIEELLRTCSASAAGEADAAPAEAPPAS
ncbi:hypothetical protein NAP1_07235 [Erythrobacter sp. NAP1]|uniref:hypothetical protein n=1 Tax=Erythrobacter sp. NAP1 TaxID=237727 RepID=UPI0000686C2D|nr:hypothetical protein [Erythrobacter sp. NAP1]EAQ30553.1 hypothetical protein NAP1_07235 [Erythrobacter sp. NAP1]